MVIVEDLENMDVVMDVFGDVLDKPTLLLGNGPSVRHNKWGEKIDTHFDTIVRLNGAVIPGHEDFAGSKVDLWFHNFQIKASMHTIMELREDNRGIKMFVVYQMSAHQDHGKFEHFFGAYHKDIPWIYTDVKIHAEALRYTTHRPTMGLLSLSWLLKYGFTNIYFHGFDMLNCTDSSNNFDGRHYDGRSGGFHNGSGHRPVLDKKAFERAIRYGCAQIWNGDMPK